MLRLNFHLFFCLVLSLVFSSLEARPKRDVLHMKNGDRLTCEIKSLDKGQLTVKTDYITGTFVIDWNTVERIESPQLFQVETQGGAVLEGTLEKKRSEERVSVIDEGTSRQVSQSEVIRIAQEDRSALGKLDLNVSYGFSFTKSNANLDSNLDVNAQYTTTRWQASNDTNLSFSGQDDGTDSSRTQINNYFIHRSSWTHWFAGGLANFLSNSEQQLDLRTTLSGLIGREFVHTNNHRVYGFAGAGYTREHYSADAAQTQQNNAEALAGFHYSWFYFDYSEFGFEVLVHPSLTDVGMVRMDLTTALTLSVLGDNLQWTISFYDNFDSRPPETVSNNDYGISTSIGWKVF